MYCNSSTYRSPFTNGFDFKKSKIKTKSYCYKTIVTDMFTGECFVYVGKHRTDNLKDGYFGSGVVVNDFAKHNDSEERYWFETEFTDRLTDSHLKEFEELLIDQAVEKYGSVCVNISNRKMKIQKPKKEIVETPLTREQIRESILAKARLRAENDFQLLNKYSKNRIKSDEIIPLFQ